MQQRAAAYIYLSVGVLMVLVVAGVVILLDEAKIFLPLPLQDTLSSLCISWEVTLQGGNTRHYLGKHLNPRCDFSAHFSSTFSLRSSMSSKTRNCMNLLAEFKHKPNSPTWEKATLHSSSKENFLLLNQMCLSDFSCESAASLCGPWLNKAKKKTVLSRTLVNWKQQMGPS